MSKEPKLYWATHPDQPRGWDSRARSRVLHVEDKTGKFQIKRGNKKRYTVCGMLIAEKHDSGLERDVCKVCAKSAENSKDGAHLE